MLSDVEWIFVVLAVLYLIESVCWVRSATLAFPYRLNRYRVPKAAWRLLGNERGSLVLGGLLPTDATFLVDPLPLSIGKGGVCNFVRAASIQRERPVASDRFFDWQQLANLRLDRRDLIIGGSVLCRCQSHHAARKLYQTLIQMSENDTGSAHQLVDGLYSDSFSLDAARDRVNEWQEHTRRLRLAAALLFIFMFPFGLARYYGVIPAARDDEALLWYLGGVLLLWWWSVLEANLSHRKLFPDRRAARLKLLFTSIISPVVPLRAADHLARELFDHLHPLTFVAATQVAPSDSDEPATDVSSIPSVVQSLAADVVRDLVFPHLPLLPQDASDKASATIQQSHDRTIESVQELVDEMGLDFETMFAPPLPEEAGAKSYCPRCLQEYTVSSANCEPCGGRSTLPTLFPD